MLEIKTIHLKKLPTFFLGLDADFIIAFLYSFFFGQTVSSSFWNWKKQAIIRVKCKKSLNNLTVHYSSTKLYLLFTHIISKQIIRATDGLSEKVIGF